jgi:hypothetical protein
MTENYDSVYMYTSYTTCMYIYMYIKPCHHMNFMFPFFCTNMFAVEHAIIIFFGTDTETETEGIEKWLVFKVCCFKKLTRAEAEYVKNVGEFDLPKKKLIHGFLHFSCHDNASRTWFLLWV